MQCAFDILSSVVCLALQNFSTLSHKRYDFRGKKAIEPKMYVLIFSTTSVWNISHSRKNWARYDQKCLLVFMWSTGYACPILTKLEFSWQIFEKYSNIKFHENPSIGAEMFHAGRHDDANRRFPQFCERVQSRTHKSYKACVSFLIQYTNSLQNKVH